MITQESGSAEPQNQASLLSNKTMQRNHKTCSQKMKQWWYETNILSSDKWVGCSLIYISEYHCIAIYERKNHFPSILNVLH